MAFVIGALLAVLIKCSIGQLVLMTPSPTQILYDLSTCDDSFSVSVPESNDIYFWFSIDSTQNPIIGIDACNYYQGNNDFYFEMQLYTNPDDYYFSGAYAGYNAARCGNGGGAYLEYDSTYGNYQNWWLKVVIYDNSDPNARLQLTRRCEIKTTTGYPTATPTTPAPTQILYDLSTCDDSFSVSVPESIDDMYLWFSIYSTQNNSIIGIDACDYDQGNNNFYFEMQLFSNPDDYYYFGAYSGNNARCGNGGGAYLEYDSTYDNYQNWWLKVEIYGNSDPNARLQLTRRCEIKTTTGYPTPTPTTPAPISSHGAISCEQRVVDTMDVGPHYYLLTLLQATRVNFQDCASQFDPNLYVYKFDNSFEQLNTNDICDGDDCGTCNSNDCGDDCSLREEYTLHLNAGEYYVMIRPCCDNDANANGAQYTLVLTCDYSLTGSPTTPLPTPEPTPMPTWDPTTQQPSRSPLFDGETHPPTTAEPTMSPVTKRPTTPPTTKTPTGSPTVSTASFGRTDPNGNGNYKVMLCMVVMVIGILFV